MTGGANARYYILPGDGRDPVAVAKSDLAQRFAVEFGDGTHIVDTLCMPYYPVAQVVRDGAPVYLEIGGWDTRGGLDANLIEAAKTGSAPIVRAFLAKGADADARDGGGAPALMWAVAKGSAEAVRALLDAGADATAADAGGLTPRALAERKGLDEIAAMLR